MLQSLGIDYRTVGGGDKPRISTPMCSIIPPHHPGSVQAPLTQALSRRTYNNFTERLRRARSTHKQRRTSNTYPTALIRKLQYFRALYGESRPRMWCGWEWKGFEFPPKTRFLTGGRNYMYFEWRNYFAKMIKLSLGSISGNKKGQWFPTTKPCGIYRASRNWSDLRQSVSKETLTHHHDLMRTYWTNPVLRSARELITRFTDFCLWSQNG